MHSRMLEVPDMPRTWSLGTRSLAAAAICGGWVASVWRSSLIGWPLTPPLAFTHAKYAASMFEMSVKSVPGCLVLIAPSMIGVPVAAVPGLGPHGDVSDEPLEPLEPLLADDVDVEPLLAGAAALLVLLLLLLPQPAITRAAATIARTGAEIRRPQRIDGQCKRMGTSVSSRPRRTRWRHPMSHRYLLSRS